MTDAQTTTAEQTNTADLSRVASGGQETDVNASAAPTAATPTGNTQQGQIAVSSLLFRRRRFRLSAARRR
jgi:hypothetical protein